MFILILYIFVCKIISHAIKFWSQGARGDGGSRGEDGVDGSKGESGPQVHNTNTSVYLGGGGICPTVILAPLPPSPLSKISVHVHSPANIL